jgi:hypothetical protein
VEATLLGFWLKMKNNQRLAQLDADMLVETHGPRAYEEARMRARDEKLKGPEPEMPKDHWGRVRKILAARINRKFTDISTGYLKN